ncbi:STAS domain-containing protein [Pedobacter sp. SD-b]|uniref:Anti-sigma factor antagonist n=1 Tax=Pedobacter segetis TaxID=2793069 RepID=A0ABS1BFS7_9SPHI|nr:STAS domain-containing protein [Pedobacter segetis]MBK0381720.1 STAS domain-containing protein [Pedobacter segetis]
MNFTKEISGDITIITLALVEASLNESEEFKNFIYDNCGNEAPKMVIDMSNVLYMDSSFIGALVAGLKKVLSKNGEIVLANISNDVMALFELTRLDKVFKIYHNTDEAINSLK